MTEQRPLVEKVLDLVLYAPAGFITRAATDLPTLVADGRARLEQQVKVAHWIGEMAVTTGRKELGKRLRQQPTPAPATDDRAATSARVALADEATVSQAAGVAPSLPFAGYDELAAAQIVQLLGRLPHTDLALIRDYETAGRARRTILHRIDQLTSA